MPHSETCVYPPGVAVVPGAAATAPVAERPEVDLIAQLQKLGERRDAGILTDEEFTAKKREILARL
jgi:hypothetical protein